MWFSFVFSWFELYQEDFGNFIFETWNSELETGNFEIKIWNFETWDFRLKFGTWNMEFEIWSLKPWKFEHEIWGLKFVQLEILEIEGLDLKIGHWEGGIFKLGNENFELKIWDLEFEKKT